MFLNKVTFKEDVRLFKKGTSFSFDNQVTIISGDNGSGKSTLIGCIRNLYNNKWTMSHDHTLENVLENENQKDVTIGYIDLSSDLLVNSPEIDFDNFALQKKCMGSSSGEGAIFQLVDFLITHSDKPLIIIDEPERGLSIKKQLAIFNVLKTHIKNNPKQQIIMTTHSEYLMGLSDNLLSMSHLNYISVDDYLKFVMT